MIVVWREDSKKVKGEVLPRTCHEGTKGGWSAPRPGHFKPQQGWGGRAGPVWTSAENLTPTGIRSPDRPARIELLYRLSYSDP
jgi:hypothetical protein